MHRGDTGSTSFDITGTTGTAVDTFELDADMLYYDWIEVQQGATASGAGGTPTLDGKIQSSLDGTNWDDVKAFAQLSATGRERLLLTREYRASTQAESRLGKKLRLHLTAATASGTKDWTGTLKWIAGKF